VQLKAISAANLPLREGAPEFAPAAPAAPEVMRSGDHWQVRAAAPGLLDVDGRPHGPIEGTLTLPRTPLRQCFSLTRRDAAGLQSLPGPVVCVGATATLAGPWPRIWTAVATGTYALRLAYANDHGPINTGITAAVKRIVVECAGQPSQTLAIVMPQSIGERRSTTARFAAGRGARCTFMLEQGFNMSFLATAAHYTGGQGGASGPVNAADIGALLISPLPGKVAKP
ncbi:MAG: Six-hairpin glycosidase-like protein, partial [Xanthomonadaceae bacterium]|nr:Six-hairpin glycosidase-like protein [Xanthomonadaceae bacterium]